MKEPIILFGATGLTGRLVAAALCHRGLPFAISGRDPHRLEELATALPWRPSVAPATLDDPASLDAAFAGRKVVLNCAGPFSLHGEPVVRAAINNGLHYLDSTGELSFMRQLVEGYNDPAREAGVAITPGVAYEVALADTAAAKLGADFKDADEAEVLYHVRHFHTSRGTALSALEVARQGGMGYRNGRWVQERPAKRLRRIPLPSPPGTVTGVSFPSGELTTIPQYMPVPRVTTFISVPTVLAAGAFTAAPLLAGMTKMAGERVEHFLKHNHKPPTEKQRQRATFVISVRLRRGRHGVQSIIRGHDIYAVTAWIMAYAADRLLHEPAPPGGVLAPAQLLEPVRFFQEIRSQWVTQYERVL